MKKQTSGENPITCGSEIFKPSQWILRVDGPESGEENMRRDREALEAQRDVGAVAVVRFFQWTEPTVSYGRLQNRETAQALSRSLNARAVVQRPTGGGMVLHDKELSFSIAWRRDVLAFPKCFMHVYRSVHQVVADVLRARGFDVTLYQPDQRRGGVPGQCFVEPAEGDVIWMGQKVVGGALKVTSWGRLYQGDIRTEIMNLDKSEMIKDISDEFRKQILHC